MLRLFFVPERELPTGVGFRHFGPEHLMMLTVLAVLSAGITAWGCRMKERGRIRLLRTMAGIMVALEIWKDGMLAELDALPHVLRCDIEALAREAGFPKSANMVLLGLAAPFLGLLTPDQLLDAVGRVFARKGETVVQANQAAFRLGLDQSKTVSK